MRMQFAVVALASAILSTAAFGQASQANPKGAMSSPNAQGVQIQGNTNIKAENANVNAVAVGEGNTAKNTTGAIKGGTQIQGNTNVKASQKNANAVAVGKNNAAANEAGVIGGK